ncbi:hypothetical protein SSX86_025272 [Deinandra increscens subsp. villosa]|uniref:RING-type E3 ubiquitin transferase n=1 Tax=Deinandra increscens subsp. villosa TaxID=3103831 RepID=A0AAP0GN20_9ASTR
MGSTTENITRRTETANPMARFSIGEDDEDAPATSKRIRLSESSSQSRRQSQSRIRWPDSPSAEEDGEEEELIPIEDVESDSEGSEEEEDDEDEELEAEEDEEEVEVCENVGNEDDDGDFIPLVAGGQNQNQQMTSSTAASLLRGLSDVAVANRTPPIPSTVFNNTNGELQVVLTDPDVLDCPICLEPLCTPVFQCENGHIACSSCCSKVKKKCPSCCMPIGYNRCRAIEKVIESVKISCKNAINGCQKTMIYSKKSEHEQMCPNAPCFCPHPSCPFSGYYKNMYIHFGIQHAASTTRFTYNTHFFVHVATHQKHIFLQEQHESVIFIVNHQVKEHGRVLNVDCVGPNTLKSSFEYQIIARNTESTLMLKCIPEIYTKWSEHPLKKNYLTVPSDFFDFSGTLPLHICIKKVLSPAPSEGDSVVVKRKEIGGLELERSRRKKKKKQGGTPRPACSWVHFSREFIKEYSASHPEASGLKVATRAASDAWKVMTLEEKSKYTKRAKEVWNDYLSSAPAREPKPRKQANLVTRCSPGRLVNVLKHFTVDQKEAVKSMGFGSLLDLKCRTLRRSLCLWLLERFNTIRRSLEICGERIPLHPHDVELVMGLPASGKEVVNSGPDDLVAELRQKYNASNRGISVRFLEERLGRPEAGDDFKRAFLLYILGTLLCPTARLDVSPSFLHLLTDMDSIHEYNWAKFLLDRLVREVSRYRQGKQRAVGGCLLFLQIFYYESVAIGGTCELGPVVVPCLSLWTEEAISEREKQEKELGGYGCGEVICKERGLGLALLHERYHVDVPPSRKAAARVNRGTLVRQDENLENVPFAYKNENTNYGYKNQLEYTNTNPHDSRVLYTGQSTCPLLNCNFTGLFQDLSDHFSSKHWDSGRRFQYNSPLPVSLGMDEMFLVLQAEEDGVLFLLNKGTENIGHTVMVTCIGPSNSNERFLYYLVSERGNSSLRLKSYTQTLPGRVECISPSDCLLVPFGYLNSSGELNLEVCIWNPSDLGEV